ncbi:MAG: hypothetical protein P4L98_05675 [Ancalomicrobiaceae bacterium]|nr:hypothetical protein [Ancalomicrobiaceae bacterium]
MSGGPQITAVILAKDDLSPHLQKLVEMLAKIGEQSTSTSREITGTLGTAARTLAEDFKVADTAAKELFSAVKPQQFARAIGGVTTATEKMEASFKRTHSMLGSMVEKMNSMAAIAIGMGVEHVAKSAYESAVDREKARQGIITSGATDTEMKAADETARRIAAKTPGVAQSEIYEAWHETRTQALEKDGTVDVDKLARMAEVNAQAKRAALASNFEMGPNDFKNLGKALDLSGRQDDPNAYKNILESYVKSKQVHGSFIKSEDYLQAITNAKSSGLAIDDNFFYNVLPQRMAEQNASRLGNEISQTSASMIGGRITKSAAMWMQQNGMVDKGAFVADGSDKGHLKATKGLIDAELLASDQQAWVEKHILGPGGILGLDARRRDGDPNKILDAHKLKAQSDRMVGEYNKEHGLDAKDETYRVIAEQKARDIAISNWVNKSGFRGTVVDNLVHMAEQAEYIEKQIEATKRAPGLKAGEDLSKNPAAAMEEFKGSLQSLMQTLGSPAMGVAGKALDALAKGITDVTAYLEKNPLLQKLASGTLFTAGAAGGAVALNGLYQLVAAGPALTAAAAELTTAATTLKGVPGGTAAPGAPGVPPPLPSKPGSNGLPIVPMTTESIGLGMVAYEVGKRMIDYFLPQTPAGQKWDDMTLPQKIAKTWKDIQDSDAGKGLDKLKNANYQKWLAKILEPVMGRPATEQGTGTGKIVDDQKLIPSAPGIRYTKDAMDELDRLRRENYERSQPGGKDGKQQVEVTGNAKIDGAIKVDVGLDARSTAILRKAYDMPLNVGSQGNTNPGDSLTRQHGRGDL